MEEQATAVVVVATLTGTGCSMLKLNPRKVILSNAATSQLTSDGRRKNMLEHLQPPNGYSVKSKSRRKKIVKIR